MNHALCAGLPLELVEWLNRRLPGLQAVGTAGAREARELLVQGDWALLVVDHDLGSHGGEPLVRAARGLSPVLPVVYCLDPIDAPELVKPLVRDLAVNRVLFRPLDREELAIAAARLVGVELPGVCPRTKSEEQLAAGVAALWQRARPSIAERIALLDEAVSALAAGVLPRERREQAQREAHKIAGSVGTFGFTIATYHARLLERLLAVDQPGGEDVRIAALHVSELRRVLTQHAAEPTVQSPDAGTKTTVLLVDADATLRGAVAEALRARSVEAAGVAGADEALRVIEGGSAPELTVVGNPSTGERSALLAALRRRIPPVPAATLTEANELPNRTAAAHTGTRECLNRGLAPESLAAALETILHEMRSEQATVLAVDDDPVLLDTLRVLLEPTGLNLVTVDRSEQFWDELARTAPDLVVLDIDIPGISGVELCHFLRSDPRYATLPVVFLTASVGRAAVERIFAAGVDDYVAKPIIPTEFLARIHNRLERIRLLRQLADTDPLTGLANRRASQRDLDRLLELAGRERVPLALAVLDLDRFKNVNDRWGHAIGDEVLQRLGRLLRNSFRGQDVTARWGGEEFVLGLYGLHADEAARRIEVALEAFATERFAAPDGAAFTMTFSAGVAAAEDATGIHELYRLADAALYAAKSRGRARVIASPALACSIYG